MLQVVHGKVRVVSAKLISLSEFPIILHQLAFFAAVLVENVGAVLSQTSDKKSCDADATVDINIVVYKDR